jgi:predicted Rossmann fold flavoprotein
MRIVVAGGGAAGFFAAITAAAENPDASVIILEKSPKLLSKVRISGGGRCNVTHDIDSLSALLSKYPRGSKFLKNTFSQFGVKETINWFQSRGVRLKTEEDGRMFPVTDDSETIINCLLDISRKLKIEIRTNEGLAEIKTDKVFTLKTTTGNTLSADALIITTGGHNNSGHYQFIRDTGHSIVKPVPSLFTFNVPGSIFKDLMGVSIEKTGLQLPQYKLKESGPFLFTHWGISGPAVIRLSAWAAREMEESSYKFRCLVNFTGKLNEDEIRQHLLNFRESHPKKLVAGNPLFELPKRLWEKLVEQSDITDSIKWGDLPKKNLNKLVEALTRTEFQVQGKTTFKEEFVTAGGVSLDEVNPATMESKLVKGIFFAGEVLDIDGVTGGFNFQSAWSTGWIAGKNAASGNE